MNNQKLYVAAGYEGWSANGYFLFWQNIKI